MNEDTKFNIDRNRGVWGISWDEGLDIKVAKDVFKSLLGKDVDEDAIETTVYYNLDEDYDISSSKWRNARDVICSMSSEGKKAEFIRRCFVTWDAIRTDRIVPYIVPYNEDMEYLRNVKEKTEESINDTSMGGYLYNSEYFLNVSEGRTTKKTCYLPGYHQIFRYMVYENEDGNSAIFHTNSRVSDAGEITDFREEDLMNLNSGSQDIVHRPVLTLNRKLNCGDIGIIKDGDEGTSIYINSGDKQYSIGPLESDLYSFSKEESELVEKIKNAAQAFWDTHDIHTPVSRAIDESVLEAIFDLASRCIQREGREYGKRLTPRELAYLYEEVKSGSKEERPEDFLEQKQIEDFEKIAEEDWRYIYNGPYHYDEYGNLEEDEYNKLSKLREQHLESIIATYIARYEKQKEMADSSDIVSEDNIEDIIRDLYHVDMITSRDDIDSKDLYDAITTMPQVIEWAKQYVQDHLDEKADVSDSYAVEYARKLAKGEENFFVNAIPDLFTEEVLEQRRRGEYTLINRTIVNMLRNDDSLSLAYVDIPNNRFEGYMYVLSPQDENGVTKVLGCIPASVLASYAKDSMQNFSKRVSIYHRVDYEDDFSLKDNPADYFERIMNKWDYEPVLPKERWESFDGFNETYDNMMDDESFDGFNETYYNMMDDKSFSLRGIRTHAYTKPRKSKLAGKVEKLNRLKAEQEKLKQEELKQEELEQ